MSANANLRRKTVEPAVPALALAALPSTSRHDDRLMGLSSLAAVDIETALVANLSGELHALFDPVSDDVLPIYFGPLLGRLYLEGLCRLRPQSAD